MRKWLLALTVALATVGCGSAPSSDPTPQLPAESSPAASTSAVVSSGSTSSIQFAGRLTFPASSDWTVKVSGEPAMMTLEFSEGGKRGIEGRPKLQLVNEQAVTWKQQFEDENRTNTEKFISFGPCTNQQAMYDAPVRYTEGDITVGGRLGEYYKSTPCVGTPTGDRHAWIFRYTDANGNPRGLMIYGFTGSKGTSDFPYLKAREWIGGAT